MNKWELLAAIQALTIYVLVRLGEAETENNNIDFLLVKLVSVGPHLPSSPFLCHSFPAFPSNPKARPLIFSRS